MSLNAFYSAYGNTQNALGDPRGDARKREQEDMRNAMLQTQFDQQQAVLKAQQAEEARIAAANRARFNFRTQRGYGQPQAPQMPAQPQMQAMPSAQGGAPIEPQGPVVDPVSGREVDQVTVTGVAPVPMPNQEDELTFLLRDAYTRGDEKTFNELFDAKRQSMSAEELAGRQQIAAIAGQILQLPTEQRGQAVMQALQRLGVDPQEVAIDDFVDDPVRLEQSLRFEMMIGSPQEAMKENLSVAGNRQKQMDEQRFAPVSALNLGNEQLLYGGTGDVVDRFRVGVSPNTVVTAGVQRRGQDISAATTRRGQNMTDARARENSVKPPTGYVLNPPPPRGQ